MQRKDLALVVLALADGEPYTPVQIQKAVFLATENLPGLVNEGETYSFQPYDYGPFDRSVYVDIGELSRDGLAEIGVSPWGRWSIYRSTREGIDHARDRLIASLGAEEQEYLQSVCRWVRSLSFSELVSAIYKAYPRMRENSIFTG